jgi:hypothetical protein
MDASIVPSLVSVASCVASNTPIFSFVTCTSASIPFVSSSPHVPKPEQYPSCEGTVVVCAHHRPSHLHGEVHKTKKKTSEEEQEGLALLGCSCYKALMLNLLTRALTSSYLAPQDGEGNQQVSNLKEGVSVLARESL